MNLITPIVLGIIASCQGFTNPTNPSAAPSTTATTTSLPMVDAPLSRRAAIATTLGGSLLLLTNTIPPANAIDSCPPGSKNCLRQTWTPPSSISAADATSQLREALSAYPQEGLEDGKVDGGGYTVITDTLGSDASSGIIKLEYRSSGKGAFAKLFNAGKPFVDDLIIEPNGSSFEFRSSSRVGDSDFGVNGKRLSYIGGLLKGKGWSGVGLPN